MAVICTPAAKNGSGGNDKERLGYEFLHEFQLDLWQANDNPSQKF